MHPSRRLGRFLCTGAAVALALGVAGRMAAEPGVGMISGDIAIQGALYPPAGGVDWVKNPTGTPNFDAQPGVNCARAVGQVNGVRIADHVGGSNRDSNIFLTGGKLEDASTWNVGPGTLGSAKYNCTQAYLANNRRNIFFAMERQGNDGTTAFDFEFNKTGSDGSMKPVRQVGDVLFTFEVRGSGNTGSVTPYVFVWNGTSFINRTAASAVGRTNNAGIKPAPWGWVDSKNAWTAAGSIPNFQFAEAGLSLADAFGAGFDPCGAFAYVQIRTRSSAVVTSDLKDTTPVFRYDFGSPTPVAKMTADPCDPIFSFDGSLSTDAEGKTVAQGASLSFDWQFTVEPNTVVLTGGGVSGANGLYTTKSMSGTVSAVLPTGVNSATVKGVLTVSEGAVCQKTAAAITVTVFRSLVATITSKAADGNNLNVKLTGTAPGASRLQWQILKGTTWTNLGSSIDVSGSASGAGELTYSAFEADATPVVKSFTIEGITYQGKQWTVQIRLRAVRLSSSGAEICAAVSAPAPLAKVTAVDP